MVSLGNNKPRRPGPGGCARAESALQGAAEWRNRAQDYLPKSLGYFYPHAGICLLREGEREKEKERRNIKVKNTHHLPPVRSPTEDWNGNLGMLPGWGSHAQRFGAGDNAPTKRATWPGHAPVCLSPAKLIVSTFVGQCKSVLNLTSKQQADDEEARARVTPCVG